MIKFPQTIASSELCDLSADSDNDSDSENEDKVIEALVGKLFEEDIGQPGVGDGSQPGTAKDCADT